MPHHSFKPSRAQTLIRLAFGLCSAAACCAAPLANNIHLDAIHAADAYAQGYTGTGVRFGILDSGFDVSHIAFEGKDIIGLASAQYEERYGMDPNWEAHNHGTHVAGIAAGSNAVDYGVAKDASLLLLSATLTASGSINEPAELYQKAFDLYPNVTIYNNSWGWVRGLYAYRGVPMETEAFNAIFSSAVEKDKLLVFAAGNYGGLAPEDPVLSQMRNPANAGHLINVVNIESDHLFEEGRFIHGNVGSAIEGSNMGLFASLWTIAAPGTNILSASAGSGADSISMTGTSMAAPHVSGTLALVEQSFPWMSASQLADTVLSTAQKPTPGTYDVIAFHPDAAVTDDTHPNADFKWQFGGSQRFYIAQPAYAPEKDIYETNVHKEAAAIVFWGSAGYKTKDIAALKREAAERISAQWLQEQLEIAEWEFDSEAFTEAVWKAYDEWKKYFIENCIIVEYGIGAGLLDAGKAAGGLAELNVNRMARWEDDDKNGHWTLPIRPGLNGQKQIAYTLTLSENSVSRFTNDIIEVDWDPVLHITTEDEFVAYNEALAEKGYYEGSSPQTKAPDEAYLPVSLVVLGTLQNGAVASAGTLVFSGTATYSGSTDVVNGATLIVNGTIEGDVQSDKLSTIGGMGTVGSLTSRGTLSPGDDAVSRLGTLTVNKNLELAAGSSLILDVSEHTIDQIRILGQSASAGEESSSEALISPLQEKGNLKLTIRTGGYVDHVLSINPVAFFPDLTESDDLLEQLKTAELSWDGGITFNFSVDENGYFSLHRVHDGMQKVAQAVSLPGIAHLRAQRLDEAVLADGVLQGVSAEFVNLIDTASENLMGMSTSEEKAQAASDIASIFAAIEPDAHLAFDAAALSRSVRLREISGLSPLTNLSASAIVPEAWLTVERSEMDVGKSSFESTRTILSAGARRSFGDWAFGWRLGAFYDNVECRGKDEASAEGIFASLSAVREIGSGFRFFGEALLGYGIEDRQRVVHVQGVEQKFDNTVHSVSAGAAVGLGQKLELRALPLDLMPYVKLSWDGIDRDGISESNSIVSQSYQREFLNVAAVESGLALKSRTLSTMNAWQVHFEGKAAYRNRFHVRGDETYAWSGISDESHVEFFDNRHAFAAQCTLGLTTPSGHDFAMILSSESGDSGLERWGASLRWNMRF